MTGFFEGTSGEQEPIPHSIEDHDDANVGTKTDGDILQWDAIASEWVNAVNTPSLTLDQLTDVDATSPTTNYVLTWDGADWIPAAVAGGPVGLNGLTDVTITAAAEGDTLQYVSGDWVNVPDITTQNPLEIGDGTADTDSDAQLILWGGDTSTNAMSILFKSNAADIWGIDYIVGNNDLVVTNWLDVDDPEFKFRTDKTFETPENFLMPQSSGGSTPGLYWGTLNGTTSIFQNAIGILTIEADTSILLNSGQVGTDRLIVQLLDSTDGTNPQTMLISNSGSLLDTVLLNVKSNGVDGEGNNTGGIEAYEYFTRKEDGNGDPTCTIDNELSPKAYVDKIANTIASAGNFSASQIAQIQAVM